VPASRLGERPVLAALAGAIAIAFSGILFRLAHVSPETGGFWRCAWALPALWPLVRMEERRFGPRPRRARLLAYAAGAFFAADLIFWHHAIEAVGAGLATVLGNTQVVLVGLLTWLLFRERPPGRALASIPIAAVGVVLISGIVGGGAYGSNPPVGVGFGVLTGLMYTGFLITLREGNEDVRRPAGPLFDATLVAALACAAAGAVLGTLDLTPSLAAQGWLILLGLSSQALGWYLISVSLPRLPAALTSVLLTLQPVASVGFAALILGESPSAVQLAGVVAILVGLLVVSTGRRSEPLTAPGTNWREAGAGGVGTRS
jgi:drug/metabolite transporter (DMT)-like permease